MTEVRAVHPGTGHVAVVDSEALEHHLRQSGWLLETEYEENKAAAEQKAADAAAEQKAAAKPVASKETKA